MSRRPDGVSRHWSRTRQCHGCATAAMKPSVVCHVRWAICTAISHHPSRVRSASRPGSPGRYIMPALGISCRDGVSSGAVWPGAGRTEAHSVPPGTAPAAPAVTPPGRGSRRSSPHSGHSVVDNLSMPGSSPTSPLGRGWHRCRGQQAAVDPASPSGRDSDLGPGANARLRHELMLAW